MDRFKGLREARQLGLLNELFLHLEKEVGNAEAPLEPTGPEWPYKRAFKDGELNGLVKLTAWLDSRSKPTPVGAQNTED